MAGTNLVFSKVVATPTPTAWSQAYSAGSLFAALSLETKPTDAPGQNLSNLGKDLISTLESEFFTLETKDLESIKGAITTTFSRVNESVISSFVICYLNENILYLYACGLGKAVLKRGDKIGTVLEGEDSSSIKSASGYVQAKDLIILQTKQFQRIISPSILASSLDKNVPAEITEEIAPHIHEKTEGGASAIVLSYNDSVVTPEEAATIAAAQAAVSESEEVSQSEEAVNQDSSESLENAPEVDENELPEQNIQQPIENINQNEEISEITNPTPQAPFSDRPIENPAPKNLGLENNYSSDYLTPQPQAKKRKFSLKFGMGGFKNLSRSRKIILLIGLLLVIIIFVASIFTVVNKKNSNNQVLFEGIYNEAKTKFEEGQSLQDLNASLAQENFAQAKAILEKNKDTFPEGSEEDQQIEALLAQVNSLTSGGSSETSGSGSSATEVDKSESKILSYQIDNPNGTYFTQNEDFVYFLDSKGVNKIDKGNDKKEVIIEKDWDEEGGIGAFGSNIYVLDKTENIFKFVPSGSDFTKSNYITGSPDLDGSAAMGIDGSIYVLNTNGTIDKYIKGAKDDFSITGLEKPMSNPTRIVTTEDGNSIYVLDKGNSRIVVLDKEGKFTKAYSADIIKSAQDIDPQEPNNAIFVLSNDKIYKINTNWSWHKRN